MVSSYKPKSIERIGFRDLDYDFFRNVSKHISWNPTEESIFIKDEFYSNGSLKSSTYYFRNDYIVLQNSSGNYNRTNIYQDGILVGY